MSALREGSVETPSGDRLYYQDASTEDDLRNLWAVLDENSDTGSPNLENATTLAMLNKVQSGGLLSEEEIGTMLALLRKHASRLKNPPDGSVPVDVPDIATARILGKD